jgi:hypothetical protein
MSKPWVARKSPLDVWVLVRRMVAGDQVNLERFLRFAIDSIEKWIHSRVNAPMLRFVIVTAGASAN